MAPENQTTETALTYAEVGDDVMRAMGPPGLRYSVAMFMLAAAVATFFLVWNHQIQTGMGVAGISHPVGWGVYIGNFVFWVGIAHSGTLISAILHLVRARWRDSVARSAEAMTVFAVLTAGLFPLIHLGRFWVFYFIIPYPSERQLWPNFTSPLVWDVCAVGTYLTVSTIFFYVGMIPDLAAARDRYEAAFGPDHDRSRFYRRLALGWSGAGSQWRHYGRAYLFFAALATPLVVSVHSVVSWDFAMGILPGWHSTIFAPYFVAGAIHSGLAMVLTLMIPMRYLLRLERVITLDHFEAVAKTILVTTLIVGYAYVVEPFIAWYSGDRFEQQFAYWRATGSMAWAYWALFPLNVFFPLVFLWRRARRNLPALFAISILINIGMWLERYFIVVGSTSHDFLPHNWGTYAPTWVELTITCAAFAFFLFWFLMFAKVLPTVAISEVREAAGRAAQAGAAGAERVPVLRREGAGTAPPRGLLGIFRQPTELVKTLRALRAAGHARIETFSPIKLPEADRVLGRSPGPVRIWTLCGAVSGFVGGFALAIGTALMNGSIVGAKHPVSIIPYCVVAFEGTVLLGALANLTGLVVHARLGSPRLPGYYDRRFSRDRFGVFVACPPDQADAAQGLMRTSGAEEIHVVW